MNKYILIIFLTLFAIQNNNAFAQYKNIKIDEEGDPNEPSIMMDPKNANHLIAASNINNVYTSTDGGYTWKKTELSSTYGVYGDPCVVVDTNGYFYFFHLAYPPQGIGNWVDRIVCQKYTTINGNWTDGTFTGLNGKKVQDKEWAYVDRNTNNIYVVWTQFDKYESLNPADSSTILFSKSTDGGLTWTQPIRVSEKGGDCLDSDNTAEGAVPCSGPNGEIYLSWSNGGVIYFDRSTDGGKTWLKHDKIACKQPGGWDIKINGIYRANGMAVTCSDLSNGPYRGNIYINYCAERDGLTDTDVWLTKSTDGGDTWSEPKRVNDGPKGTQEFFNWMTVDQATGYIYVVFYDRRNYTDTRTDVYLAYSTDGGETFINKKISETPFTPDPYTFFGDYTNITAYNGKVVPIWARMNENSQTSIWCAVINDITGSADEINSKTKEGELISKLYPNPANNGFKVDLYIKAESRYTIDIFDALGNKVANIISDSLLTKGNHTFQLKSNLLNLKNGTYFIVIKNANNIDRRKLVIIEE